jgi:hypothetical protein
MLTSGPRHLRPRRFSHAAPALRPHLRQLLRRGATTVTLLAVAALSLASIPGASDRPGDGGRAAPLVLDAAGRSAPAAASRGKARAVQPSASPSAPPAAPAPVRTDPVGGLSRTEMDNALAIVEVARRERLPKRAAVVAVATALQESHLRNLANPNIPDSLNRPNQGVGYDYDSVGLFQQRPNWGSVDQLMDPHESARRFYSALLRIPGWGDYAVTVAAQMVQGSAFPDAYAKWEGLANQVVDATM